MNLAYLYSVVIRVFAVLLFISTITSDRFLFFGVIDPALTTIKLKSIPEICYITSTLITAGILWIYYRSIADWIADTTRPILTGSRIAAFLLVATGTGTFITSIYFRSTANPEVVIDHNIYILYFLVCLFIVFVGPSIDTQIDIWKRVAVLKKNLPED